MDHGKPISANDVIADVLPFANDTGMKRGLDIGWYLGAVQTAITELGYDTMFAKRTWTAVIPRSAHERCMLEMPEDLINITKLYAFSGSTCNPVESNTIWYAEGYHRDNAAQFKEQKGQFNNNLIMDDVATSFEVQSTMFYNTMGNVLMLSDACLRFEKVYMLYRGTGVKFGDAPVIPHFLREAVTWMVVERALTVFLHEDRTGATLNALKNAQNKLYGDGRISNPGALMKARRRVQASDTKEMEDMQKYLYGLSNRTF